MSDEYRLHFSDDERDAMLEHDAKMASYATDRWVESVARVPVEQMALMIAEDPSVMTALIGALRYARWQLSMRRAADLSDFDRMVVEVARDRLVTDDTIDRAFIAALDRLLGGKP